MTKPPAATADLILDAAERMTQSVGYNGLSFRDIAAAIGIKSASVHYHYPSKGQLGAAVARRYTDRLVAHLDEVDAQGATPQAALAAYVAVFRATLEQEGRMCLCGMLAAETDAIPQEMRAEVRRFVDLNVQWLSGVLARVANLPATNGAIRDHALMVFAALEGAMLVVRGTGDTASFNAIAERIGRLDIGLQ